MSRVHGRCMNSSRGLPTRKCESRSDPPGSSATTAAVQEVILGSMDDMGEDVLGGCGEVPVFVFSSGTSVILVGCEDFITGAGTPGAEPSVVSPNVVLPAAKLKLCCTFLLKVRRTPALVGQASAVDVSSCPGSGIGSSDCVTNVEWIDESDMPLR